MTDLALIPRPVARDATRRPITMDEVLEMQAQGRFAGQRTQLLDGEIHIMPPDGLRHINYAMEIGAKLVLELKPKGFFIGIQTTLHLSRYNGPSPDSYVLSAGPLVRETPADRIKLVVEVAVTSLSDDLKDGASRYARHGVAELWVVDVEHRVTHVHRDPQGGVYPPPLQIPFEQPLSPELLPDIAIRLADFDPAE
jgi:Uma2 family endonuclease